MKTDDLNRFLQIKTLQDVADILEISAINLKFILYILPNEKRYTEYTIVQKNSKTRKISSPDFRLKQLQRKLLYFLTLCHKPKKNIYGFIQGRSIKHNAANHTRKKHLLNIDIQDFFPSINFGRVRGLFLKDPFNFPESIATILAQLCCHNGRLPQGAPTSPIISNLICYKLDNQLNKLARETKVTYTRYADDLTFSSNLRVFPKEISEIIDGELKLNPFFVNIIRKNGFEVNSQKTRYSHNFNRQEVTGLIVNELPNVKRKYVRQIRAMIHAWSKYGYKASNNEFIKKYYFNNSVSKTNRNTFKKVLKGKIEFLKQIKGPQDKVYINLLTRANKLAPKYFKLPENDLDKLRIRYIELKKTKSKKDARKRGLQFESLLNDLFSYFAIEVYNPFRRNENGEQIDGGVKFGDWYYLFECKWQKKLSDIRDLDSLTGKVSRSGKQTMGFFISIGGWSKNVPRLLKQNTDKVVILINGEDIEAVLNNTIQLHKLLDEKIKSFNLNAEPYVKPY